MDKRKGYKEVEDNFHPAFRFFFLENFPEPFAWYNSRLTFTRYSSAVLDEGAVAWCGPPCCAGGYWLGVRVLHVVVTGAVIVVVRPGMN